jgi:ferritin-like metal-binding protein YciE
MNNNPQPTPIPDVQEMTTLFIHALSDIFNMKTYLISYLPALSSKASFNLLKTTMLNSCVSINTEIIRMNAIFKILNQKRDLVQPVIGDSLNIEQFISKKIEYKNPFQADYALIIHLTVLAGMQISTFQLLSKLSGIKGNSSLDQS